MSEFSERKRKIAEAHTPLVGPGKGAAPTGTRAEREASVAKTKIQQAETVTGGGMSEGFKAKLEQGLAEQAGVPQVGMSEVDLTGFEGSGEEIPLGAAPGAIFGRDEEGIENAKKLGLIYGIPAVAMLGSYLGWTAGAAILGTSSGAFPIVYRTGGKLASGVAKQTTLTGINPKTVGLASQGIISKMGLKGILGAGFVVGNIIMSLWARKEASEPTGFRMNDLREAAEKSGDWTMHDKALQTGKAISTYSLVENIATFLPVIGPAMNIGRAVRGIKMQWEIDTYLGEDSKARLDGKSEEEIWAERREEQAASEKAMIDYYNSERLIAEQQIIDLRTKAAEESDRERRAAMEDQALFWAEYAAQQRILEREQAEWMAEFWLKYLKQKLRLQQENSRSRLVFGLLR